MYSHLAKCETWAYLVKHNADKLAGIKESTCKTFLVVF